MTYCPECDWQLEIARRMTNKDKRQRWVYHAGKGVYAISEVAIPFKDAISVRWMPTQGMVVYSNRPAVLAHSAIGAL